VNSLSTLENERDNLQSRLWEIEDEIASLEETIEQGKREDFDQFVHSVANSVRRIKDFSTSANRMESAKAFEYACDLILLAIDEDARPVRGMIGV